MTHLFRDRVFPDAIQDALQSAPKGSTWTIWLSEELRARFIFCKASVMPNATHCQFLNVLLALYHQSTGSQLLSVPTPFPLSNPSFQISEYQSNASSQDHQSTASSQVDDAEHYRTLAIEEIERRRTPTPLALMHSGLGHWPNHSFKHAFGHMSPASSFSLSEISGRTMSPAPSIVGSNGRIMSPAPSFNGRIMSPAPSSRGRMTPAPEKGGRMSPAPSKLMCNTSIDRYHHAPSLHISRLPSPPQECPQPIAKNGMQSPRPVPKQGMFLPPPQLKRKFKFAEGDSCELPALRLDGIGKRPKVLVLMHPNGDPFGR